jgi:hypothetical protein
MTAYVRRVIGTNRALVYHHCGQRMQHMVTYLRGGQEASDWWCNQCAAADEMLGDEDHPQQPPQAEG